MSEGIGKRRSMGNADPEDFWGPGYDPECYEELRKRYADWTEGREITSPSERSLYRQICLLETIIRRDGALGKPIDKNINTLNTLIGSMNLKPAQKKEIRKEEKNDTLGTFIKAWEEKQPLPELTPEQRDINGLYKYISVWYLGHMCRVLDRDDGISGLYGETVYPLEIHSHKSREENADT